MRPRSRARPPGRPVEGRGERNFRGKGLGPGRGPGAGPCRDVARGTSEEEERRGPGRLVRRFISGFEYNFFLNSLQSRKLLLVLIAFKL